MKDAYIRIDGRIRADLVQEFLQGIRDLEQRDPDGIHLAATMREDDASLRETLQITADKKLFAQIVQAAPTLEDDLRLGKLHSFEETFDENEAPSSNGKDSVS